MSSGTALAQARARLLVLPLALLVMLGVSCSSGGTPAKPKAGGGATTAPASTVPRVTDPCALVTLTQAEALIGGAELLPGLGVRTDDPNDRTCTYTAPGNGAAAQVEVLLGPRAKAALDADRNDGKLVAVPLIGHEAHEEPGAIFFRKLKTWVAIRVTDATPSGLRARLETLARTITPKI